METERIQNYIFRITGTRAQAAALLKIIEGRYFGELTEYLASGGDVVVPTPLPWYPDQLAWQLNVTRKEIRRQEVYFRLHNFLVAETESGSISRQETVSMLPPLVLGVKPHHAVLDMCAAPGGKAAGYSISGLIHCEGAITFTAMFLSPRPARLASDVDGCADLALRAAGVPGRRGGGAGPLQTQGGLQCVQCGV